MAITLVYAFTKFRKNHYKLKPIPNALDKEMPFPATLYRHKEKSYPQCYRTCGHWYIYLLWKLPEFR